MNTKFCPNCKKEFIQNTNNQIYCILCGKVNKKKLTRIWKNTHKEELKKWRKKYNILNREHIAKEEKKYRQSHREKYNEYMKQYRKIHEKEISEYNNKYGIDRRKTDINFKVAHYLRTRINKVLKGINKSTSTIKLIGCPVEFLKKHLENQFQSGMSWSNYGLWHIDHIRPCASFDLSKPEEQRKCFHYTNLQPLWAEENLRKN